MIHLQRLINICKTYSDNQCLLFNAKKSAVITFVKSRFVADTDPQLMLNDP